MILIPKLSNIIELGGTLAIAHFDGNGKLIDDRFYSNIVVTAGKNWIASRMIGTSDAVMSYMALGGSSTVGATIAKTTPLVTNTELTSSGTSGPTQLIELARVGLATTTISASTVTYTCTFIPGTGSGAVIEAGIFNASTGGTMLCKTSFDVVNKAAADTITITWRVTIQ